ncbi:cobaltochelatase subunit CobN [Thiorhodospira sibirica]|uniref:cobaltochelatase subunit CobN n=1 Tax=Thiorhodospira sibirica TaxID=154347 RepID=UPI00022C0B45|nr:cobaltochelatase subunit CobN [Thiorhodospira sibirica]
MSYQTLYALRLMLSAWVLLALTSGPLQATSANPPVTLISSDFILGGKFSLLQEAAQAHRIGVRLANIDREDAAQLAASLDGARLVILDAPREHDARRMLGIMQPLLEAAGVPWVLVAAQGAESGGGLPVSQRDSLYEYYRNGGAENFHRLFRFVAVNITRTARGRTSPPIIFPESGIYHPAHPALVFADLGSYERFAKTRVGTPSAVIGLVIHQSFIANGTTAHIDALIAQIEAAGARPLVFYHPLMADSGALDFVQRDGQAAFEVLINFQAMYQGQRREEYERLGVPVLQALSWRSGDTQDWHDSVVGLPMGSVPFYLAVPEFVGLTDPLVVAAVEDGQLRLIPEQAEALLAKVFRLAHLRRQSNAEKRVALMFYNYPPGQHNLAASFLNVPRSLAFLSDALAQAGYTVTVHDEATLIEHTTALLEPFYRPASLATLQADPSRAGQLPLAHYLAWYQGLPDRVRDRVEEHWGAPEEDPMLWTDGEPAFVIPRLLLGNLLIMPQPLRGRVDEPIERSIYHDTRIPLTHFYMAAYLYAREHFSADALIHFGTHGTQEWTPGKERGLWVFDDPYLVLGDTPVIYPYIVDNIGEATQAKRRGRATIISHQTPPFAPAGLQQSLLPLHDLLHEYELLDEGSVRSHTEQAIVAEAQALNLLEDIGWEATAALADFHRFEPILHDYLHDLAQVSQPLGLHSFGQAPQERHRLLTVMQMLGEAFYNALGVDIEELFVEDFNAIEHSEPYQFLAAHLLEDQPLQDPSLAVWLETAKGYFEALGAGQEYAGLLAALDGRYLPTHYGGDPIRNPESLPTGRNLYGFDPSKLPTQQAWEAGRQAFDQLLESHREHSGEDLQKIAFSLWSVEAMRHLGILEAQVFYALGVQPQWDRFGRVTDIEVIPLETLGRPRVDVVISATGLYRDHFPHVISLIARAVEKIAALDEPNNAVQRHTQALEQTLLAQGIDAALAREYARVRVFSNQSGVYGTGLDEATLASDSWEDETRLAELYLQRMQYAFGVDQSLWGSRLEDINLYAQQLHGVQAAVLSRSSNLYGMLSTDDPFQYLGGLSLAVRHLSGQSPALYISNLRQPERMRVESAGRFLAAELRSRYFHPQWISAMQQEGYAGTLNILDTVNNFWGWQAVAPEVVRDDQWESFVDVYIRDALELGIREWFAEHNPNALAQITERMLEAIRKGYWQAADDTVQTLLELYHEALTELDYQPASSLLQAFAEQAAAGFGLDFSSLNAAQANHPPSEAVTGQQLQPVSTQAAGFTLNWTDLLLAALALLALLGGVVYQARRIPATR